MKKLLHFFRSLLLLPLKIKGLPGALKVFFKDWVFSISTFSIILLCYLLAELATRIQRFRFAPPPLKWTMNVLTQKMYAFLALLNRDKEKTINRVNLIDLAIRNMSFKKSRAIITVGGMALGIGIIVFLVSIGYGIEKLVTSRVARLDELKQTEVTSQPGSQVALTDQSLSSFTNLQEVEKALPMIAVVSKVNYNNSSADVAVYGVTADYLEQSAVKPIQGKVFESNEVANIISETTSNIAGASIELAVRGQKISDIIYTLYPEHWIPVRKNPSTNSEIIGYTKYVEPTVQAIELYGGMYPAQDDTGKVAQDMDGNWLGKWIQDDFPLWKNVPCEDTDPRCEDGEYAQFIDENSNQIKQTGYIAQTFVDVVSFDTPVKGKVLGISDANDGGLVLATTDETTNEDTTELETDADTDVIAGTGGDDEWVDIASESGIIAQQEVKKIEMSPQAKRQAVVNRAMLQVLGINEEDALNKTFQSSFVVVGELLDNQEEKIESLPTEYTIIGVVPDDKTPFFYVPFIDLRSLGITKYSQVKIVSKNTEALTAVRQQIESLGFSTRSVADTVEQIERLFGTVRQVLAIIGMVALGVAALGMFNTLTVSLLERTREVGLMKAMGMKSHEVQELFLTESMIMGFFGGIAGIIIGFAVGKLLGVLISTFAIFKGQGFLDVSYIPLSFVGVVFFLSLLVGIFTGVYPARRAKKISALNALRYE